MRRITLLAVLCFAGCLPLERNHHGRDSFNYCDDTGCYDCDDSGCSSAAPGSVASRDAGPYGGWGTGGGHNGNASGAACDSDWNCPGGYDCQRGACVATSYCNANGGCPSGEVCDSRTTCVKAGDGTSCTKDGDCSHGFCDTRSGVCIRGYECYDGACSAGFSCDARGICIPEPCSSTSQCMRGCYCANGGDCVETKMCQSDGDCSSLGMVCDLNRHTCQPQTTNHYPADAGVPAPDAAVVVPTPDASVPTPDAAPPAGSCMIDTDCDAGQICQNGQCVGGTGPKDGLETCVRDAQCGGGICRPNYLGEGLCHAACQGDLDCGTGDSCQDGYCWTNPTPQMNCLFNWNCGDGYTCINATCHVNCDSDLMCANPTDFCDQSICQPDWRIVSECTVDTECQAAGQECVDGQCLFRCLQDADCSTDSCVNGYCSR